VTTLVETQIAEGWKTQVKSIVRSRSFVALFVVLGIVGLLAGPALAQKGGKNGTTLAASKTIDICTVNDTTWRYSGEASIWNQGAVATQGLTVQDCIQTKSDGEQFADVPALCVYLAVTEIPAGTTLETATVFPYVIDGAPVTGDIRNIARAKILNHSGALGTPTGPEPKATWTGGVPPPCTVPGGCTYTIGYWGNKPGVEWPEPYHRTDLFYLSGQTWNDVINQPGGTGYYILAVQYIGALLNQANGAPVPAGVQAVLNDAGAWFEVNAPAACAAKGSCGTQKTWGGILDTYNNGIYEGGPSHCE
jgi:hypothetical protein